MLQAKSANQYMEWMGHLQSHHVYRKKQLSLGPASDATKPDRSPAVVRSLASLLAGTRYYTVLVWAGRPTRS